ncbi:hypothetical protein M404DRAFT_1003981 [Pisolithus tinctorius Marx 270]|uniref:Uncharacterized protein n=1 Tax=Pisolithus tinctorius Marx 270 TaxID=870435 RepID=A0A0C3NGV7_PISTI|nr:hypothetical protein M404DRAFT_1003981 [Pisolithus tinctorius Marx 270]
MKARNSRSNHHSVPFSDQMEFPVREDAASSGQDKCNVRHGLLDPNASMGRANGIGDTKEPQNLDKVGHLCLSRGFLRWQT